MSGAFEAKAVTVDQMVDILDQCGYENVSTEVVGESVVSKAVHKQYGTVLFVDSALANVVMLASPEAISKL